MEFDGSEYSCIFVYDISTRKRAEAETTKLEAELRQARKMEAVGVLAGGIAHDFNNIIGAIVGSAELVLDELPPRDRHRDHLQRILDAGVRAGNLVKQILTFSRNSKTKREPVMISTAVSEALELVGVSVSAMVDIREDTADGRGLVYADSTQIHQVVMNLCANASHAMTASGGVLKVGVHDVHVDTALAGTNQNLMEGPYVRLSVSDTGCGMDVPLLDRMFEPFFTTKAVDEGTGMGLAVVHGIVMEYGGAIAVRSLVGSGTTIDVYLPRYDGDGAAEASQCEPTITGNERVLLVDDEAPLVEVAQQMLERLGYQVVAVGSALEALQAFRSRPDDFDVVITDQAMPRMSGMDLAKNLRSIRQDIPVVVASGYSETVTTESVMKQGLSGYVGKPYSSHDLGLAIRRALGRDCDTEHV